MVCCKCCIICCVHAVLYYVYLELHCVPALSPLRSELLWTCKPQYMTALSEQLDSRRNSFLGCQLKGEGARVSVGAGSA